MDTLAKGESGLWRRVMASQAPPNGAGQAI
jgi:hypothetical protein